MGEAYDKIRRALEDAIEGRTTLTMAQPDVTERQHPLLDVYDEMITGVEAITSQKGYLPMKFTAREIKKWDTLAEIKPGRWVPARPVKFESYFPIKGAIYRIRAAWGVLTGRYDVLDWEDQP